MIASMAVDSHWRLYYNDAWWRRTRVEENAAVLIHEVSHLLREHEARKQAAAVRDAALWNTATDCEINDDLVREGLPLPDDPPLPGKYGLNTGENAETYYRQLLEARSIWQRGPACRAIASDRTVRLRLRRARRTAAVGAAADDGEPGRRAGRRSGQGGARAARRRAAHPGSLGRCRRRRRWAGADGRTPS